MELKIEDWSKLSYSEKLNCKATTPTDCSFVVGEGGDKNTFWFHKLIVSRASPVFETMLNTNEEEEDNVILLPSVSNYIDFKEILEYVYYEKTDSIAYLSMERLKHIAYLADIFKLDKLLLSCHLQMEKVAAEKQTSFHDFLQIFEYEKKMGRKIINFKCWGTLFPYKPSEITNNTSMYDLEPLHFYDLLIILESKFGEAARFCLIENYAKIHRLQMEEWTCKRTEKSKGYPMKTLREMFELIDFKKITPIEFKNGPAVSKIWKVSPEEKLQILFGCIAFPPQQSKPESATQPPQSKPQSPTQPPQQPAIQPPQQQQYNNQQYNHRNNQQRNHHDYHHNYHDDFDQR